MEVLKQKNYTNKVRQNPKEKEQNTDSKATRIPESDRNNSVLFSIRKVLMLLLYTKLVSKGFEQKE